MKLILKKEVEHLGRMGDLIDVADGYARNYLLPRGMGITATTKNMKELEHEKRIIAEQIKKERTLAEGLARQIGALDIRIPVQAGEEGKLFGSVSSKDIAEAIASCGTEMDKRNILLEKPIKELGIFQVPVRVYHDVTAQVKVSVVKADA